MHLFRISAFLLLTAGCSLAGDTYAVVASEKIKADAAWAAVAASLTAKHPGAVEIHWSAQLSESLPALRKAFPKWVAFVARPEEVTVAFVRDAHQMLRRLDDDPFTDAFWGIVTGFDAANARQMAAEEKPLTIRKVAAGTEVELSRCEEGIWYCELNQGRMVRKQKGGEPKTETAPADTTEALAKTLADYHADLFITSGHATERDWQIGFRYRNGSWHSKGGELFGTDTSGRRINIRSENPKVFMPIGNCLIGHIDGPDAMALAFMKSAGVRQMLGYVKPTWYGYQGWGCLDYFVEQPGRFSFCEAFFANHHALIHRLLAACPEAAAVTNVDAMGRSPERLHLSAAGRKLGLKDMDVNGLLFDRDVVVFYGDPAWDARMAPGACSWTQELKREENSWRFVVSPRLGKASFATVNHNGTQRGGRPVVQFLPQRIAVNSIKVTKGGEWNPVIADNFLLVPAPAASPEKPMEICFDAEVISP
ncbi:MAG: hypothetical protein KA004_11260 [Verrucomicrobiales bacterium]|nr:hypothetical protein [Verrucomicrobiales bacterium]